MRAERSIGPRAVDAVVIGALTVLAGTAFGPAYGGARFVAVLAVSGGLLAKP